LQCFFAKCFRGYVHCTVQICGSIGGRSEAVPTTMHRYEIPNLQLQPSVAVATCRKTCFPQFVTSIQGKTISWLSEVRVLLQNFRVSFWHPKSA